MPDTTLTTTTPDGTTTVRPVPPSWASVAPLLQRWQMALVPYTDRSWDVYSGYNDHSLPRHDARGVPFAALPQAIAIADVAARCAAEAALGEEGA